MGHLRILYFAAAREAAGTGEEVLDASPADVAALRRALEARHPALARVLPRCRLAVNREFAADAAPVPAGAEIAVIPPVSGGAPLFKVVDRPIELAEVVRAVQDPNKGGLVTFTGNVRGETKGRKVVRLEYEAYAPMAEAKLAELAAQIEKEHGATLAIVHRVGVLAPGEAAVVIAAAAPHRAPAFRACEEAIQRLKKDVPIWKREVFEDGAVWVGMGP